jgi:hypothetical protein
MVTAPAQALFGHHTGADTQRRDPRSRLISDLFIIASGLGVVSFAALLTTIIINPGLVARFWIWTLSSVAGGLAAFAAGWSWRERMRPRSRRRPPSNSTRRRPES